MNYAYLLTGGNLGERKQNLRQARQQISLSCGKLVAESSIYETAAWGKRDQPRFLNQALKLETTLLPELLLKELLHIEDQIGRVRKEKFGPRLIDIDILFYEGGESVIMDSPHLKLPHPEVQNRRFALTPLNEIAPTLVHPVLEKNISQLLEQCPDDLEVFLLLSSAE